MSKETVYKEQNKFGKSVGAGMKSVFGGSGKTFYTIEHKSSSQKHKAGETQEIIIDYVELGRDSKCQVSFGDSFKTVSRRHAAITKDGSTWVLKQLSENNPTLINGKAINKLWYLQNGDEIQLSYEGPRLGFHIPTNNVVSSIGFTKRLSLFRQQALKPYKQAITALSFVFVIGLLIAGFFIYQQHNEIEGLRVVTDQQAQQIIAQQRNNQQIIDSLRSQIDNIDIQRPTGGGGGGTRPSTGSGDDAGGVPIPPEMKSSVYFISCTNLSITLPDGTTETTDGGWSGTGFLLEDGRFVTARHVVEPWYFLSSTDDPMLPINIVIQLGGTVSYDFTAYSPDGTTLQFNWNNFTINRSDDESGQLPDGNIVRMAKFGSGDNAYIQTNNTGVFSIDAQLSNNLVSGQKLHVLGYPLGLGAEDLSNISPLYSTTDVAMDGLHESYIYTTDRNFDHGNSGGPVMVMKDNKFYVIGIVSAGVGDAVGFIVPISAIN